MTQSDSDKQIPLFDCEQQPADRNNTPGANKRVKISPPPSTATDSAEAAQKPNKIKAAVNNTSVKSRKKGPKSQRQTSASPIPEGDVRLTANIRDDLHLKLKIAAARRRTTIGDLIEELVEQYL